MMFLGILLGFILTVLGVGLYLNLTGQVISIEPDTLDDVGNWFERDLEDEGEE